MIADEREQMFAGAIGGLNYAAMSSWVLRTSSGQEIPSQLWDFGDTQIYADTNGFVSRFSAGGFQRRLRGQFLRFVNFRELLAVLVAYSGV